MSEKNTEFLLEKQLTNYNKEHLYTTIFSNKKLVNIFKECSKKKTKKYGNPDRIYLFDDLCIVFECKKDSINSAMKDLKFYFDNMDRSTLNHIFLVGFSGINVLNTEFQVQYSKKGSKLEKIYPLNLDFNEIMRIGNVEKKIYNEIENKNMSDLKKNIDYIHNIIRDNCNLSNSDKPILISCILVAFLDEEFEKIFKHTNIPENLSNILLSSVKKVFKESEKNITENDLNEIIKDFNFIKIHENLKSGDFLYKLTEYIYNNIITKNYEKDLLNLFYSEFMKYGNNDSQSLGIVLTPDYISDLMTVLANIRKEDTVLDLCAGTGSFLMKSLSYNPKKIIGIELQNKLFSLMKCNFLLRKVENYQTIKSDCFSDILTKSIKCSRSIINPPFGMKQNDRKELNFVLRQIDFLEEEGISVVILPSTCINNNKFLKHKEKIMDYCNILTVINLDKTVFYPHASVQCSIMVIQKKKKKDNNIIKPALLINFENDGYSVKKHRGRIPEENYTQIFEKIVEINKSKIETDISILRVLKVNDDWNFHSFNTNINFDINFTELSIKKLNSEHTIRKNEILKQNNENFIPRKKCLKFLIGDIFDIESVKRTTLEYVKNHKGTYPYISASSTDNGITGYTDKKTHEPYCITLANSGSVGSCFLQTEYFCGTDSIYVLKLKDKYGGLEYIKNNIELGLYLCLLIEKNKVKYNFGRACRMNKLITDTIELPVNENNQPDFKNLVKNIKF